LALPHEDLAFDAGSSYIVILIILKEEALTRADMRKPCSYFRPPNVFGFCRGRLSEPLASDGDRRQQAGVRRQSGGWHRGPARAKVANFPVLDVGNRNHHHLT
jgi:hypothetical protein